MKKTHNLLLILAFILMIAFWCIVDWSFHNLKTIQGVFIIDTINIDTINIDTTFNK